MKTKMKLFLGIFFILICILSIKAQPVVSNVILNPVNNVELFGTIEISFDVSGTFSNVYDSSSVYVNGRFFSPIADQTTKSSNLQFDVPAFYTKFFTKHDSTGQGCSFNPEVYVEIDSLHHHWKIRLTPNYLGSWTFYIRVQDSSGVCYYPSSGLLSFNCITSGNKGFIKKASKKYLERSPGGSFFPVGEDVTAQMWPCNGNNKLDYGTNELKTYIDSLSKYHANVIRLWIHDYDSFSLLGKDWPSDTLYDFHNYNLKDACQVDTLIDYANKKNISIILTLFDCFEFMDFTDRPIHYWHNYNPYHDSLYLDTLHHAVTCHRGPIESPYGFFTDSASIQTKNYLRYVIARWGYATNILAWELWNEMDAISPTSTKISVNIQQFYKNVVDWHKRIYDYIKFTDPNQHLISTSFISDTTKMWRESFPNLDFTMAHYYNNPIQSYSTDPQLKLKSTKIKSDTLPPYTYYDPVNFQNAFFNLNQQYYNSFHKPFLVGEWGFINDSLQRTWDPNGFELHNSLWASAFSGSLGSVMNWFWKRIEYVDRMHLYKLFQPISLFMNNFLKRPLSEFNPGTNDRWNGISSSGLRYYSLMNTNNDTIMGWMQDIHYTFQYLFGNNHDYLLHFTNRPIPASTNNTQTLFAKYGNRYYNILWFKSDRKLYDTASPDSSYSIIGYNKSGTRDWSKPPQADTLSELIYSFPNSLRTNSTFGDGVYIATLDCNKNLWREGKLCDQPHDVKNNIVCYPNNSQIFYLSTSNQIRSIYWNSQTNSWEYSCLDNVADSVVGCLAVGPEENVYYINENHALRCIYWDKISSQWKKSLLCGAANSNVKGPIAVAPNGQVFFRTIHDSLNNIWLNPKTKCWARSDLNFSTNGDVDSAIAISFIGQVFYKTTQDSLNNIWWDGNMWRRSNLNRAAGNDVAGNITINWDTVFYKTKTGSINFIYWDNKNANWYGYNVPDIEKNVKGDLAGNYNGNIFYFSNSKNIFALHHTDFSCRWSLLDSATYYPENNPTGMASEGGITIDNYNNVFFLGRGVVNVKFHDTINGHIHDTIFVRGDNTIHRLYYSNQCYQTPSCAFWRTSNSKRANLKYDVLSSNSNVPLHSSLFDLFPNPANSNITIVSKTEQTIKNICIYNLASKIVREININNENYLTFDVSFLSNGVYILRISTNKNSETYMKLIINHQ